jgi:hypothetical protein
MKAWPAPACGISIHKGNKDYFLFLAVFLTAFLAVFFAGDLVLLSFLAGTDSFFKI